MPLVSINFFLTNIRRNWSNSRAPNVKFFFFFLVELQKIFVTLDGFYPIYWCNYKGINIYCACVKIYLLVFFFMLNVWQKIKNFKNNLFAKKKMLDYLKKKIETKSIKNKKKKCIFTQMES